MQKYPPKIQVPLAKLATRPMVKPHPPVPPPKRSPLGAVVRNPKVRRHPVASSIVLLSLCVMAFATFDHLINTRRAVVVVTAYTSSLAETDSTPYIPACGGELVPGDKAVAVSRDLEKWGMKCGATVWINDTAYQVRDRMHKRWKNRIDIYTGDDKHAAKAFGKRRLAIKWRTA